MPRTGPRHSWRTFALAPRRPGDVVAPRESPACGDHRVDGATDGRRELDAGAHRGAGGENLFGEAGRHSPWLDPAALERSDPDAIIVFPCGFSLARLEAEASRLAQLPGWSRLRAVWRDAIFLAGGNQYFNRPGPRLVETLEMLAEMLHPEAFEFGHEGDAWRKWRPPSHTAGSARSRVLWRRS